MQALTPPHCRSSFPHSASLGLHTVSLWPAPLRLRPAAHMVQTRKALTRRLTNVCPLLPSLQPPTIGSVIQKRRNRPRSRLSSSLSIAAKQSECPQLVTCNTHLLHGAPRQVFRVLHPPTFTPQPTQAHPEIQAAPCILTFCMGAAAQANTKLHGLVAATAALLRQAKHHL
jgi:hypothetical protein